MRLLPINLILSLLILISVSGIGILIQVKLSRSKNKYLGLILPVLSFLFATLMVLGVSTFTMVSFETSESVVTMDESGEIIEESEEIITDSGQEGMTLKNVLSMSYLFLVGNIPTIILGGIYLNERNKIGTKKAIEKMKIEDL